MKHKCLCGREGEKIMIWCRELVPQQQNSSVWGDRCSTDRQDYKPHKRNFKEPNRLHQKQTNKTNPSSSQNKKPNQEKNKPIKKSLIEPWSSITCKNPTIWLGWFKEWPTTVQEAELSFPLLSFAETYLKKQWLYFLCQSLCTESVSLPDRHCVLLWFNLSQPRPMQLLSCSPSSRTRVRIGKGKSWKTPGLRWI